MIKILAILMTFSTFCAAGEAQKKFEFKAGEAEILDIRAWTADMDISAAEGPIKAETSGEYSEELCSLSAKAENGTLSVSLKDKKNRWKLEIFGFSFGLSGDEDSAGIKTEKKWFYFEKGGNPCKAGLRITAPKNKKLIVKSGAGNMKITGFSAGAEIDAGAGNLELKNFSGPLNVDSGAGSVKGDLYSEDASIGTGAGSVDLKWNSVPKKGKVSVSSGAGDAVLSFPEATKMFITHKSGAGSFDSAFGNDKDAPFTVELKTGAGSQEISKY